MQSPDERPPHSGRLELPILVLVGAGLVALLLVAWTAGGPLAALFALLGAAALGALYRTQDARFVLERLLRDARLVEARYRAVIEQSGDAFLLCDADGGRIEEANAAARELLGLSAPQRVPGGLRELVREPPRVIEAWLAQAARPGGALAELRLRAADEEELHVEARGSVISHENRRTLCVVLRDLTGLKRAQSLEADRRAILERVAANEPLEGTLELVARLVERQVAGSSVHLEVVPREGACAGSQPPLPEVLLDVGRRLAPATGEGLVIVDLAADGRARDVASALGFAGAWVLSLAEEGERVGMLVALVRRPREPRLEELAALDTGAKLAHSALVQHDAATRLAREALLDHLTQLPNRRAFDRELRRTLEAGRNAGTSTAVVCIDLDRFKAVNDTYGHDAGDELLQQVARRLRGALRESDLLARIGGDEFMVLLRHVPSAEAAAAVVRKLEDAMVAPFLVASREIRATASMGYSWQLSDGADGDALRGRADVAMYAQKSRRSGRSREAGGVGPGTTEAA